MAVESKPFFHPEVLRQQAYERFETVRLASDEALLKRFVFLLGAERVVPVHRECHLYELLRASETVGRALTNQFYARYADIRQRVLTRLCRENAAIAPPEILRCTQKLLDRVLFCAFCEDRGLLPAESLKRAFEQRNPYNPQPVWLNFRGLFRAIDEGNAGLNIPAYNGGLFAPDPALDALQVPDEVCAHFKELGDYDYRPAREVAAAAESTAVRSVIDVDILGHIFEQSITDLERLRESLSSADFQSAVSPTCSRQAVGEGTSRGLQIRDTADYKSAPHAEPGKPGRRRKQEGAVYTPAFITRYLVEQALGGVLKTRFDTLRRQHEAEAAGTARKTLADPNAYDLATLNDPQRKALIRFWEAWQEEENSTTPSARAIASSATRRFIPKPSTGRPPSPRSSPRAASMSSSATRPTSGRNCSAPSSRGWRPTTKSSTAWRSSMSISTNWACGC
jgi:hypothetical protein